jgi:hypothetical protein
MKKNTKVPDQPAAEKAPVEYDGYYFIDVVSKNGLKLTIPARGYELKSWLAFEKALGSAVEYRAVAEKEWMKTHWTQTPYTELSVTKKPVKKAAKKTSKPKKTT